MQLKHNQYIFISMEIMLFYRQLTTINQVTK